MISPPPRPRGIPVALLILGLGLFLGGCGGGASSAEKEMVLLRFDGPLHEPEWTKKQDFALALAEDAPRVVKFRASAADAGWGTPGPDGIASSGDLGDLPGSLAPNASKPDQAYLAQPNLRRVVLMDTRDLRPVRSFGLEESPQWVAVHPGSQTLFALSEDGSTVSEVDLEDPTKLDLQDPGTPSYLKVDAGEEARIDIPERGLEPEFWLWGPGGISQFLGSPPEPKVSMPIDARSFTLDADTAQRAYVGEDGSGRVVALEGDAAGGMDGKLRVVAEQDLGQTAQYLDEEELWLVAATQDKLVQMRRDDLSVLTATDFRSFLQRKDLGDAKVSGMIVTEDRVLLTLKGEPYVLSVRKTDKTQA